MNAPDYLLIGHITADRTSQGRRLGGTASYAAPIARRFGQRVGIFTSTALDEPLLTSLLDESEILIRGAEHTTTFENIYTHQGRTQYLYHRAASLLPDLLPVTWRHSKLVHLAPMDDEVDYDFVNHFEDATIMLTPQGFMRRWDADGRVRFKPFVDESVLSAVDVLVLSKQDIADAPELAAFYPRFTEHVIITDGASGGTYYHHGEAEHYEAYPVREIDPTGAGDVFAAALFSGLLPLNYDMRAALRVAARLAALAVTVAGTHCPVTSDDIQDILREVQSNS